MNKVDITKKDITKCNYCGETATLFPPPTKEGKVLITNYKCTCCGKITKIRCILK